MTRDERLEKEKIQLDEMIYYERELYKIGNSLGKVHYIAGIDEVGRGPLAGPVVSAAVILPKNFDVPGINDSKKLSEKRREAFYDIIKDRAIGIGIGIIDNKVIDEINILEATRKAMEEAVKNLNPMPDHLLIDAVTLKGCLIPQTSIIKGDSKSVSIAAASIIAKVTRDRMMIEYSKIYTDYGFERNKGYGTKAHYEGLDKVGISPIHRKSFLKKYFSQKNSDNVTVL